LLATKRIESSKGRAPMTPTTENLLANLDGVVDLWLQESESTRRATHPDIAGRMRSYVEALASSDAPASDAARDAHVALRLRQGLDLADIVEELATLGRVVSRQWTGQTSERWPSPLAVERFYATLLAASARAGELFAEHMRNGEHRGRRLARLLDVAASRPAIVGGDGSDSVLEVFLEAANASAALLVVREDDDQRIARFASRDGFTNGAFQTHGLELDLGAVMGSGAAGIDSFVSTARGSLRQDGVGSILVTRLPADASQRTAVVLCRRTGQPEFDTTDVRLTEALGERLSWRMCRARLDADVDRARSMLRGEESFRDRFDAILAHDLRGPLMVARVGADLLADKPLSPADVHGVITRIDSALDRADRMLRDLLDANRLRAGGKLTIVLAPCDLGVLAETIAEELRSIHGPRFVVRAEKVAGFWSSDEVHRAVWNLAINAVKYGDPDTPIEIAVFSVAGAARLSVHNFGRAISAADQPRLFEPFSRAPDAASRSGGWGLGLAIVRGCAEAHGGVASVQSNERDGTTFTIDLPLDARTFAAAQ
jgi:signal transduction histidine kinase